jgi:hypothetical protein
MQIDRHVPGRGVAVVGKSGDGKSKRQSVPWLCGQDSKLSRLPPFHLENQSLPASVSIARYLNTIPELDSIQSKWYEHLRLPQAHLDNSSGHATVTLPSVPLRCSCHLLSTPTIEASIVKIAIANLSSQSGSRRRSPQPNPSGRSPQAQAQATRARPSILLHGRQVPRLLHNHHRLLARSNSRRLRRFVIPIIQLLLETMGRRY